MIRASRSVSIPRTEEPCGSTLGSELIQGEVGHACTRKAGHEPTGHYDARTGRAWGQDLDVRHAAQGDPASANKGAGRPVADRNAEAAHETAPVQGSLSPPLVVGAISNLSHLALRAAGDIEEVQELLARVALVVQAGMSGGRITEGVVKGMWAVSAGVPLRVSVEYQEGVGLVMTVSSDRQPTPDELRTFTENYTKAAKASALRNSLAGRS